MGIKSVPDRGDIVLCDFGPTSGHEQSGYRPGLVVSNRELNALTDMVTVCPITSTIRGNYFEVSITTSKTKGIALVYHVRSIDFHARSGKVVDKVDKKVLKEVIEKVKVLMEG